MSARGSCVSPSVIARPVALFLNCGHTGRRAPSDVEGPFGLPVFAKFTQYEDTMSASLISAGDADDSSGELVSGNTRAALRLLKTYGISAVCVARRFGLPGSVGGSCVK